MNAPPSRPLWSDETAADLFSRTAFPGLDMLPGLPHPGLRIGETLELCGEPSTGKTALLMEAAVRCALPSAVDGVAIGGAEGGVVVADCDGGFDVLRLAACLHARLSALVPNRSAVEAAVRTALSHIHLMRCTTCNELVVGLCRLRAELEVSPSRSNEASAIGRPRLLLIDGVSAFQWIERAQRRHVTAAAAAADHGVDDRVAQLISLLRRQRLSVAWSRSPLRSHMGGLDFPIVDQPTPHELSRPTMRWKLRRLADGTASAMDGSRSNSIQQRLQALLDTVNVAGSGRSDDGSDGVGSGGAKALERRELLITPLGVSLA